ncbi:hypothetical protein [Rubritalea tangerina]|uniref:hypothetical protein n=1 Tax=Rubritalea tangerina TaxID=430798 RepID=UPI00361E96A7
MIKFFHVSQHAVIDQVLSRRGILAQRHRLQQNPSVLTQINHEFTNKVICFNASSEGKQV